MSDLQSNYTDQKCLIYLEQYARFVVLCIYDVDQDDVTDAEILQISVDTLGLV